MKALIKSKAEQGLWLEEIAEPGIGINDVLIRVRYTGHLRYRCSYLPMGRMGAEDNPGAHGDRARICR